MRILLVRLSSLGDVVLSTPIARLLRARFPDARIDVAVSTEFADVWRANPHVERVVAVDRSLGASAMARAAAPELAERYDVVVDLQRNMRSAAIARGRSDLVLRYSKYRLEKLALVWLKRRPRQVVHIVERYIRALAPLGIGDDGEGLELWLPEETTERVYPPLHRTAPPEPLLGIAPGARHATKQWLPQHFVAVARAFQQRGWRVALVGSDAERSLCADIARQLDPARTLDAAGSLLVESVRLLDRCSVVVSNDSAIVHIAAARRVPVVAIYGSTVPELGFTPFRVEHRIVQADVSCRPCSHIGRKRCPRRHFACMRAILPTTVVAAVEELAAGTQRALGA